MASTEQTDQGSGDADSHVAITSTMAKRASTARLMVLVSLCAIVPAAVMLFSERAAVAPWGSRSFLNSHVLIGIPLLLAIVAVPASLIGVIRGPARRRALVCLLCAVAFLTGIFASTHIVKRIRMRAFAELAERSKPIVLAIRSYETKYGRPPESLQSLVPEFIATVPGTGIPAYPDYRYYTGGQATHYDGNPWILTVFTPSGFINFDQFMYYPRQNYPSHWGGQRLQRVGDWAYVHE